MSLIEFHSGEIALSSDMNNNFNYLDSQISNLATSITTSTASFASQVANLNTSVQNLLGYRSSFIATGMILPYAGSSAPDGFLSCDGSELSRNQYSDLFSVIGTTFGSSDNATFKLPDLRNKTIWGVGNSSCGTEIESQLPNIEGAFRLAGTEGSSSVSGAFSTGEKGGSKGYGHEPASKNPLIKFSAADSCDVYSDNCSIVQPPALCINFIIKY